MSSNKILLAALLLATPVAFYAQFPAGGPAGASGRGGRGGGINTALPPANPGDPVELSGYIRINDWNQYEVISKGNTLSHIVRSRVMSITIDNDTQLATSG